MGVLNLKALAQKGIPVVKPLGKSRISVPPGPQNVPSPFLFNPNSDIELVSIWPLKEVEHKVYVRDDTPKLYALVSTIMQAWAGMGMEDSTMMNKRPSESVIHVDSVGAFLSENTGECTAEAISHIPYNTDCMGLPPPTYLDLNGSIIVEIIENRKNSVLEIVLDSATLYATRDLAYRMWRNWLRGIEETTRVSPFEKNSIFWGELWKACVSCNVLVYVAAASNPDFFFNPHIFDAIELIESRRLHPKGTKSYLLLNKCDLLSEAQCDQLVEGFKAKNVEVALYCATGDGVAHNSKVLSAQKLSQFLENLETTEETKNIAFVGFPNVGKSSVINSLLGSTACAVSSTAGKTKSVSQYPFSPNINFLDVPGFVQPTIEHDPAQLLIDGVINLEQSPRCVLGLANRIFEHLGFLQLLSLLNAPINDEAFLLNRSLENLTKDKREDLIEECLGYLNKNMYRFSKGGRGGNPDHYKLVKRILSMIWKDQIVILTCPTFLDKEKYERENLQKPKEITITKKENINANVPRQETSKNRNLKQRTRVLSFETHNQTF